MPKKHQGADFAYMKNKPNNPIPSNSHPSAAANKTIHCPKRGGGGKPTGTSYNPGVNIKRTKHFSYNFSVCSRRALALPAAPITANVLKGFYNRGNIDQFFEGMDVEAHYANNTDGDGEFQCRQCAPGCESCVDNSPCLFETNLILRVMLLLLTVFTLMGIAVTSFLTYYHRHAKVGYSVNAAVTS